MNLFNFRCFLFWPTSLTNQSTLGNSSSHLTGLKYKAKPEKPALLASVQRPKETQAH